MSVTQVLLSSEPFPPESFPPESLADAFVASGQWPCSWIKHSDFLEAPYVIAYRKKFVLQAALKYRAHVTADECYHLFFTGERIGRGSERGDQQH